MHHVENILPPIVDTSTKVLIVGSMPGVQSLEKQEYYGNPRNHFWPIISALLQVDVPNDYEERIQLIRKHNIGLWDVIRHCERKGSLDSAIKNEVPNDFPTLFKTYPQIKCILFNGTKAYDVFRKKVGFDVLGDREYFKMPSTSPVPGKNIQTFEQKVNSYEKILPYISKGKEEV
jgi:hypoxanthine-DNA glycosylase